MVEARPIWSHVQPHWMQPGLFMAYMRAAARIWSGSSQVMGGGPLGRVLSNVLHELIEAVAPLADELVVGHALVDDGVQQRASAASAASERDAAGATGRPSRRSRNNEDQPR